MRTPIALVLTLASISMATPGFLGARLADAEGGVALTGIAPDSPAGKAGLKDGDVVVSVGGDAVATTGALAGKLRGSGAGDVVEFEIVRGGEKKTLTVTLGVRPLERPDRSPGMLEVKAARDLTYGDQHERHTLNLFLPVTDKTFPIVLWIHAGAWSYGDRSQDTALAMRFAERGIGFAPMSYRLSSKFWNDPKASKEGVTHPAHAEDCALAFAWLRKKFPKHPLFIAGHSCGAHLAALLAMDPRYLRAHGLELSEIKGVVAIGGAYDLVKYHAILAHGLDGRPGMGAERADAHLEWIFGQDRKVWVEASPATYLKGCTKPMLIIGEKGWSMRRYTEDFRDLVKAAGIKSIKCRIAEDRTHGQSTPLMSRKGSDPVRDEMIEFIRAHSR